MGKKKRIPIGKAPKYPTDEEARSLAYEQMYEVKGGEDPRATFSKQAYGDTIETLRTWGVKNIFFVYAYPPAGFEVEKPEDVLGLQVFEGWIFQYVPQTNKFNLLVKASRDGVDFFRQQRDSYKH
jgi:hypothetical protein